MSDITPMMTALHYGHPAEERITAIDNMIAEHYRHDTKTTICQAFWWYRKHSVPMENIDKMIADIESAEDISGSSSYDADLYRGAFNYGLNKALDIINKYCKGES